MAQPQQWKSGELDRWRIPAWTSFSRQPLHEQGGEARASATTKGVEDEKALKTSALISQLTNAVQDQVNNLLTNGVVTTGIVVGGILLAGDELLGVEQLTVCASANLVWKRRKQFCKKMIK